MLQQHHNMVFSVQRRRWSENKFNSRERGFMPNDKEQVFQNSQYGLGSLNNKIFQSEYKERNNIESCKICGSNNHTALNFVFTGGTTHINLRINYQKQWLDITFIQNHWQNKFFVVIRSKLGVTFPLMSNLKGCFEDEGTLWFQLVNETLHTKLTYVFTTLL